MPLSSSTPIFVIKPLMQLSLLKFMHDPIETSNSVKARSLSSIDPSLKSTKLKLSLEIDYVSNGIGSR